MTLDYNGQGDVTLICLSNHLGATIHDKCDRAQIYMQYILCHPVYDISRISVEKNDVVTV